MHSWRVWVTFPTGGSVSYAYKTFFLCDSYTDSMLNPANRGVISRIVNANDGTGPHPADAVGDGAPTAINVLPIRITTTLDNSKVSKIEKDYDSNLHLNFNGAFTESYGNVMEMRENDYGSGAPGPLLRKTDYTYKAFDTGSYLTANIIDRVSSVTVYDGSSNQVSKTNYGYDEYSLQPSGVTTNFTPPPAGTPRGNQTSINRWLNTTGGTLNTITTYYDTGMPYQVTDSLAHVTTYSYSGIYAGAYVTQITMPQTGSVQHVTGGTYDFATGKIASFTDQNGSTSNYQYDTLWRVSTASFPDGGQATFSYPNLTTIQRNKNITSSLVRTDVSIFDGLGRLTQTQLCEDGPTCSKLIRTVTTYDGRGQASQVYNSTRCNPPTTNCGESTWGYTTYGYDALGRTTQVTQPDGSVVTTSYSGNITTVTDEAGKKRQSTTDGLGRLTQVVEDPGTSPHLNYVTSYSYDALDNLNTVLQNGSRQRTFVYNSLSQLTSASNPESGAINYPYDNDGNVVTKTDARGITTCFGDWNGTTCNSATGYDALNRVLKKTYSDGTPSASFTYDTASLDGHTLTNPVGRLVKNTTADGKTATWNSYDQVGRIANQWQCSPLNCGATPYTKTFVYDFLGDHTSDTYSYTTGTLTISYSYDNAARPLQVTSSLVDSQHPATLATVDSSFGYWPNGAIRKITLGNGLTETAAFNNRLQPCRMNVNSTGAYFNQCSDSAPNSTVQDFNYGFNFGSSDNGNVASWTATGQQTFSRSFAYDSLNRIATMQETSGNAEGCKPAPSPSNPYTLSWTIDAWGNRANQTPSIGTCSFSQVVDANNRFIAPYQYDAAGNMTNDGSHSYTFDAENRVTQVDGGSTASYVYDADGRRAWKNVSGTTTDYLYDLSDNIFAIFGPGCTAGCWTAGAEYLNGQFLAEYANGTTYFVHKDHLGSSRLLTGLDQSVCDSYDYLPYGEQLTGGNCTILRFTGKEHDTETGLDDFGARYFSSPMGRFMSPDPENAGGDATDPQSWSAYAYVLGNPLNLTDPNGMGPCDNDPNQCIEVTAPPPAVIDPFFFRFSEQLSSVAQRANDYLHLIWDWWRTSRVDPGCLAAATAAGAAYGASVGTAAGPVLQAALAPETGGASELFGGPAGGAALGRFAGAGAGGGMGYAIGQVACRSGSGSGGGSSRGSTGRTTPANPTEQAAMDQAKANPTAGQEIPLKGGMKDPRWPASQGWVKMRQNINGVEIQYVRNTITGAVDDFKLK